MRKAIITVFSVVCLSSLVHAEFTQGSQTVAVFGGLSGTSSDYSYQPGTDRPMTGGGGAFGAQYVYYAKASPAIGFGIDLASYLNGTRTDDDLLSGGYDTDQRVKSFVGMAIAKLAYPRGMFRPYIFGGLGMHQSSQLLTATPQPGVTWSNAPTTGTRVLVDEHKTNFALGYGIGFDIYPAEAFFVGAELRGAWLAGIDNEDNAAIKNAGYTQRNSSGYGQGAIMLRTGMKF